MFDLQMGSCMDQKLMNDAGKEHGLMVCDDDPSDSISFSDDSGASSTSSDFTEDFTSSSSTSISSSSTASQRFASNGPLFELSELMAHLPIKRGLSKHYQGKSQSYTCLSNLRCADDLAKKQTPDYYSTKKIKYSCKSYGGYEDCKKSYTPRTCSRTISKKASKSSNFSCLHSKKKK